MSEFDKNFKKKKTFSSAREFTPRKPVILTKNDREAKETDRTKIIKEKPGQVEKEKPPVIMIKAREPSTAKETEVRAQSPKKAPVRDSESETPTAPVIKIAQNENKEKKVTEIKASVPVSPMTRPVKLIDDYLEFSMAASEFLQDANSNFLVVGIIGGQGVGKSTVMNILAHNSDLSTLYDEIMHSHEIFESNENTDNLENGASTLDSNARIITNTNLSNEVKIKPLIFKCQDMEQIETAQSCTVGVDMYVTNSRIILLDTGPIYSVGGNRIVNVTNYNGLSRGGLEISAFLLSVCHVVILIQDWFSDLNVMRFIQSAEMVKPSIPAASNINQNLMGTSSNHDGDTTFPKEHFPQLLFLQNKCSLEDYHPQSIKFMQDVYRKAFKKSKMNIHSGMYMYDPDSTRSTNHPDALFHNLNAERCGKPLNLFLLPLLTDETEKGDYRGRPTIEELSHQLRMLISGSPRSQITNVQLNEKTWLQYCNKTWDNVKKSTFFIEYHRLLS